MGHCCLRGLHLHAQRLGSILATDQGSMCRTQFVLDPNAVEEATCNLLGTLTIGDGGVRSAFFNTVRPGATVEDVKDAIHLACSTDAASQRIAEIESIKQSTPVVGDQSIAAEWAHRFGTEAPRDQATDVVRLFLRVLPFSRSNGSLITDGIVRV